MGRRVLGLTLALGACLGSALPAAAQAKDTKSPTAAEVEAPTPSQEYVQVTATRIPEKAVEVPVSMTIIRGQDLVRRGATDLRSALALAGGLDIAPGGDGGPASSIPELWGLKEFDAFLLVVDGVPWGGAFNPSLATLDLTGVDRIEVLRGSAPVMYGATSFAGVIHVIHSDPGTGERSLRLAAGSYGSGSVSWYSPLREWAGVRSSLTLNVQRQGFRDDRTEFERGHLRWQAERSAGGGRLRWDLDGIWQRQDPASPHPRAGSVLSPDVPLDANHNPSGSYLDERRLTLDGSYERKAFSGTWSSTLSISRASESTLRGFLTDLSGAVPDAHGIRQSVPTTDIYFDSHVTLSPRPRLEVVTGVDHLHGSGDARGGEFDYFVPLDGRNPPSGRDLKDASSVRIRDRREFSGLYAQAEWTPGERWLFVAGSRLNRTAESRRIRSLEFSSGEAEAGGDARRVLRGSGFAGATWTAWRGQADSLRFYLNYRSTYKPAAIDFGLDSKEQILAPETAHSFEAGMKSRFLQDALSLELSGFQMDLRNLVVSQSQGGTPALVNAGAERFRGIEVEATARLAPALSWRAAYSLHDSRFRDFVTDLGGVPTQLAGHRLEMSARNMAAMGLVYDLRQGWRGSVDVNWVGSRFLNRRNTAIASPYATWSAGIGYRLRDLELRLDGRNLNNERPPVAESELGDAQYYRLPARSIELNARWTFGPRAAAP